MNTDHVTNYHEEMLNKLHDGLDPYPKVPDLGPLWYNDPGAMREEFETCIDLAKPGIIVEVGSYVGESAIHMAKILERKQMPGIILCIDTWLGGIDHWTKVKDRLRIRHGRPTLYEAFLKNVINHGMTRRILPITMDSSNGYRWLAHHKIEPDMIYIDASHEYKDALNDFSNYHGLLKNGGVMMTDDLTGWFPGVVRAWETWTRASNKDTQVGGEKGWYVK